MSYTDRMESALFELWDEFDNCDEDYSSLIDELNSKDAFRTFGDGLVSFLQKRKPEITAETAIKCIEKLCEETGVEKSDISSINALKGWFREDKRPKKGEDGRTKMFALAFILQLTPDETAELFHRVYLDRAFDYRNADEIIYYFCLQNGKSWSDAKRLIEEANSMTVQISDHTVYTAKLRSDIDTINDENDLLSYIARHGHNLEKANISAKKNFHQLLVSANKIAKDDAAEMKYRKNGEEVIVYKDWFAGYDKNSNNFTYDVIINTSVSSKIGTTTLFNNARLPKEIKNRFPEAGSFSKKEPTYEEMRKMIILLFSYIFWYKQQKENKRFLLDDYIAEVDFYLSDSGLPPMYYGNPYDWMFLYCALAERPLDTFRGILAEVLSED